MCTKISTHSIHDSMFLVEDSVGDQRLSPQHGWPPRLGVKLATMSSLMEQQYGYLNLERARSTFLELVFNSSDNVLSCTI